MAKKYILTADDVVNNLTSTYEDAPLSAYQGKVLKGLIDGGVTPSAHAPTHASGGDDPISPSSIGAEPAFTKNSAFNKSFGTAAGTVCEGDDSRLMTSAERTKLTGIEDGAEVNVIETVKVNNVAQTVTSKAVNIPVPTTVSELSDSGNYALKTDVTSAVSAHNGDSSAHPAIRQSVADELSRAEGVEQSLQNQIDALASKTDVVDVVGTKAELLAYDTSKLLTNDIVKVLVDESQSNAISYYRWVITAGTGAWNYVGSQGPFYTKSEADGYFVPQQRTVNGKALSGNITLGASDVGAEPAFTKGTAFNKNFGSASGTVCEGNDARLSDPRTPTAHNHAASDITSGTLDDARIPSLDASKVTTGTFGVDRIPSLTKSKISDFPTSMTPTAHAASGTTYGVASASNYGHPKATSATPSDNAASASVGTDNGLYARGDHAHRNPIHISTADPTGGVHGDVWFKYQE